MSSEPMGLSIIIPHHRDVGMLERCVRALADACPTDSELIIVDNGSSEELIGVLESVWPKPRVVRNESNLGFAAACNQGADQARGAYLVFLNSDVDLEPGALTKLEGAARRDPRTAVWQPVILEGETHEFGDLFTWSGFFHHVVDIGEEEDDPWPVFAVKGACMLVAHAAFKAIGGFQDGYFAYFEESDLCWRARLAGYEVKVLPSARVRHLGGATSGRIFKPHQIRYLSYRNRILTLLANAGPASLSRILPAHLLGCLAAALLFLVTGRPRSSLAILSAMAWPLTHPMTVRSQRKRAQMIRVETDRSVLRTDITAPMSLKSALKMAKGHSARWERPAS